MTSPTNSQKNQINLDFSAITTLISEQKFTIKGYAQQIGMSQENLRKQVFAHFGDQIKSVRGRSGGIQFVAKAKESQNG